MPNDLFTLISIAAAALVGGAVGYFFFRSKTLNLEDYQKKAEEKIEKAKTEAGQIIEDSKKRIVLAEEQHIVREKMLNEQFKRVESLIASKEEQVKRKEEVIETIKQNLQEQENLVQDTKEKTLNAKNSLSQKLAQKVGITVEQARDEYIDVLQSDLELMKEDRISSIMLYLDDDKKRLAKNIIVEAIQRYGNPTSVEKKALTITVERDEYKARVIGHNAENLVALEELTECEIIFNDGPKTIDISCFDLYKKQVAYMTIQKILKEKVVNKEIIIRKIEESKKELEQILVKMGQEIIQNLELKKQFSDDFYKIVGRLQFRSSYGQNIMKHSVEVGLFTLMLGSEIGADMEVCKIGGFLHDLGKAIDHEVGEPHDHLTKQIMEKYGFSDKEVHAAWTHHDSVAIETAEAMLVKAADAISAGRPGARQETLEKYLQRIRALESIATSYEGVNKSYAISAGRELRVIVDPKELDDEHLSELATCIAGEIEEKVTYPGKIKVNIIRSTKNVEIAKSKAA
jgi:ribonucrease Y